jgi:hypothetical protein
MSLGPVLRSSLRCGIGASQSSWEESLSICSCQRQFTSFFSLPAVRVLYLTFECSHLGHSDIHCWDAYLELYFLNHLTIQCLVFWRTFKLFSKMMYLDLFSPAVYQGSILALSLSCQTHVILQPLLVDGKCDVVGGPWFDLRTSFLHIRHSIPWEMPPVQIAVVVLEVCSPEYSRSSLSQLFNELGLQGCTTVAEPLNFSIIALWLLCLVCYLAQYSPRKLLETRLSSTTEDCTINLIREYSVICASQIIFVHINVSVPT